jgi:membrane associated rhomboid family serine protease
MIYETALIWVLISAGYWGVFLLRRGVYATVTFPVMMMTAAALSGLGLLGADGESPALSLAGAIGLGTGACLLVLGPLARRMARRANGAERWALARGLYEIADALQPGTGVREEKRLASAFAEIQAGNVEDAVKALRVVRDRAPSQAQRAFDEHITMIYMTAWQWPEAIAHAEATLLRTPATVARLSEGEGGVEGEANEEEVARQRSLLVRSVSAPLWVELIGAYGRVGDLSRAASMLESFEASVGEDPRAAQLLHRARLVFLAMCGKLEAVRVLASPPHSPHMARAARRYWIGVAADRAGDPALAIAELRQAIASSRGRARRMAEAAMQTVEAKRDGKPGVSDAPAVLPPDVAAVAEHIAQQPPLAWEVVPRPWLTWLECGACAVVAVLLSVLGSSTEISTLVRAGAMVRGLVADGQWWRLATGVFIHVGAVHVAVNVVSLWVIGRLAEDVFGKLRAALLFAVCGLAGATASYLASQSGISAGASGAIFGLLGAALGELTVHRAHFAAAIRNGMWGALAVVALATLVIGSQVPQIDQWAHVAGLATGLVVGQAVSPRHRFGRHAALLAWPILAGFVAMLAWGVVTIARTDFATLMVGGPQVRASVGGLETTVPRRWRLIDGELVDPDIFVVLAAQVVTTSSLAPTPIAPPVPAAVPAGTPALVPPGSPAATGTSVPPGAVAPSGSPAATGTSVPPDAVAPSGSPSATGTAVPSGAVAPSGSPAATGTSVPPGAVAPPGSPAATGTAVPSGAVAPPGSPSPTGAAVPPGAVAAPPSSRPAAPVASISPAPPIDPQDAVTAWFDGEPTRARERNFATAVVAKHRQITLPPPWQSRELELSAPDPLAGDQRYRLISFARIDGDHVILASFYAPQGLVDAAAPQLARILSSLHAPASFVAPVR